MQTRESILKLLQSHKSALSHYGIRKVGLFGSYVRAEQSPESDIDILVDFDPSQEKFDNLMAVCDLLENAFTGTKVEVITTRALSPYIGPRILKEVQYV